MKGKSRPQRWREACGMAIQGLEALEELRQEYEDWREGMPENLWDSPLGEKLDEILDLGIEEALEIVNTCDGADLPRGFGRD